LSFFTAVSFDVWHLLVVSILEFPNCSYRYGKCLIG